MHDKLFASQKGENEGAFSKDNLKQMATDLGLDSASFNECLDSGKHTQQIASDTALAQRIGVQSTPAFLVAGQPLIGAQPFAKFQEMIERNLQQK
jgi:protein-disulfide isomerase